MTQYITYGLSGFKTSYKGTLNRNDDIIIVSNDFKTIYVNTSLYNMTYEKKKPIVKSNIFIYKLTEADITNPSICYILSLPGLEELAKKCNMSIEISEYTRERLMDYDKNLAPRIWVTQKIVHNFKCHAKCCGPIYLSVVQYKPVNYKADERVIIEYDNLIYGKILRVDDKK